MPYEVLVLEDEAIVADDIRATLEKLGYSAPRALASAEEALCAVGSTPPDLALLDIRIKGSMDGIDVAHWLREKGVPVIFLTSYSDDATLQRARDAEPYGYLLKPFGEQELRTAIEIALH
jgi:CheY-like chemotaxis protein